MREFKFLKTIEGYRIDVPEGEIWGLLKCYVDYGMDYNLLKPYQMVINGQRITSDIRTMSYNEYHQMEIENPEYYYRLCAIVLEPDSNGNSVRESYNITINRRREWLPAEMIMDVDKRYSIEYMKIPR
jgi:hypothetical protein